MTSMHRNNSFLLRRVTGLTAMLKRRLTILGGQLCPGCASPRRAHAASARSVTARSLAAASHAAAFPPARCSADAALADRASSPEPGDAAVGASFSHSAAWGAAAAGAAAAAAGHAFSPAFVDAAAAGAAAAGAASTLEGRAAWPAAHASWSFLPALCALGAWVGTAAASWRAPADGDRRPATFTTTHGCCHRRKRAIQDTLAKTQAQELLASKGHESINYWGNKYRLLLFIFIFILLRAPRVL